MHGAFATFAGRGVKAAHFRTGAPRTFELPGLRAEKLLYGPGFVDLQCNGFAGVDFNRPETTPEQICTAIRAMWRTGCTRVLPTVITAAPERLEHLLRTLVAARKLDAEVRRSVPGFHLEGPFISPLEGARGAHPREHVRPCDGKLWQRLQRAAEGLIRLVTLAPEAGGALAFIRRLRRENILVALGHTLASRAQISAACAAGAQLSTHLGNGCPQMLHRHENPVLAQLGEDQLTATFIADGIHLPPDVLRSFIRAKTPARSILVSDAMAAAGAPPGRYTIGDLLVEVGRDRVVRQPSSPNFAGSALTMDAAIRNATACGALTLREAWRAAAPSLLGKNRDIVLLTAKDRHVRGVLRGRKILWA
jgi:N-acetylglucosamine-6-phosphate deacetylase